MDMGVCSTKPTCSCTAGAGQLDLVAAQGTGAIVLDLQDKPSTSNCLILLSTAGLGAVSLDLCRENFWGKQIGFFRKSSRLCW